MEKLVSLLVPCYNGERFVDSFFDSILKQTYNAIEVIFVNDGSTDKTEEMVQKYENLLRTQGISLIYIRQKNAGQAAAINTALKHIHGEYVAWLDVDDYITEDNIEKKVRYLDSNPDAAVVMCKGICLDENQHIKQIKTLGDEVAKGRLFENILLEFSKCNPGLFMVRKSVLEERIPNLQIIESQEGQNFQLLLPTTYKNKCGFIDEYLFCYVRRNDSHSRKRRSDLELYTRKKNILSLKLQLLELLKKNISPEYHTFLKNLLKKNYMFDLINLLSKIESQEVIEEIAKFILDNVPFEKERDIYIWGACDKNYKLKECMERISDIRIKGFVESTDKEVPYISIKPKQIDVKKMYLFIPLDYYQDVVNILEEKNYTKTDMCYMRMDIIQDLKKGFYDR